MKTHYYIGQRVRYIGGEFDGLVGTIRDIKYMPTISIPGYERLRVEYDKGTKTMRGESLHETEGASRFYQPVGTFH